MMKQLDQVDPKDEDKKFPKDLSDIPDAFKPTMSRWERKIMKAEEAAGIAAGSSGSVMGGSSYAPGGSRKI